MKSSRGICSVSWPCAAIFFMLLSISTSMWTSPAQAQQWTTRLYKDNCIITTRQWGNVVSIHAYDADNIGLFSEDGFGEGSLAFINEGEVIEYNLGNGGDDYLEIDRGFLDLFARSEVMVFLQAEYGLDGSQKAVRDFWNCLETK